MLGKKVLWCYDSNNQASKQGNKKASRKLGKHLGGIQSEPCFLRLPFTDQFVFLNMKDFTLSTTFEVQLSVHIRGSVSAGCFFMSSAQNVDSFRDNYVIVVRL